MEYFLLHFNIFLLEYVAGIVFPSLMLSRLLSGFHNLIPFVWWVISMIVNLIEDFVLKFLQVLGGLTLIILQLFFISYPFLMRSAKKLIWQNNSVYNLCIVSCPENYFTPLYIFVYLPLNLLGVIILKSYRYSSNVIPQILSPSPQIQLSWFLLRAPINCDIVYQEVQEASSIPPTKFTATLLSVTFIFRTL